MNSHYPIWLCSRRTSPSALVVAVLILTSLFGCSYSPPDETSELQKGFEMTVESPMPPGVTPIAYESIPSIDGRRGYNAAHFRVEAAKVMDGIIDRQGLTERPCTYAEPYYPLEDWQTSPNPDDIVCFEFLAYSRCSRNGIAYQVTLHTNKEHTEGVFREIW